MKKLVLFSALFIMVATLFFAACKKDESTQTSILNAYSNPNNPYDFAGQKHNEGLDILAQYGSGNSIDLAQKFEILGAHGFGKVNYKTVAQDFALMLSTAAPIKTIADKRFAEHKISTQFHASLIALNELVNNYGMTSALTKKAISFEHSIATLGLNAAETEALFMAASIARYSNAYWINQYGQNPANETADRKRDPRTVFIVSCDVAAFVCNIETGPVAFAAAAAASAAAAEVWDFFHRRSESVNNIGWAWGGGLYGPPCKPGYACPCTIELNPGAPDLFYMDGFGAAISTDMVVLSMDGSKLDPGFLDIFKTGTFNEEVDYTVPEEIVKEVYTVGGLPMPSEPVVLAKGDKKVIPMEDAYGIIFPVTLKEGNTVTWYVTVNL